MDCLRDWPEPVVRVQSLSDSGATTIPDRYVKPQSERASVDPGDMVGIPVVDLAMLTDDVANCEATVTAIADACRQWGFFQAINHGVSPGLMRGAREVWRGFFHLPMDEKQRYANSPKTYEGYGSRLGIERGAILDWGDYFFLHFLPLCLMDHDKWPALPPALRETSDEYGAALTKLCRRLLRALSIGLGLDAACLPVAFDDEGVCMRVNFYPRCPQPELTLGLSAHSDPGGITVLLVDDHVTGLQVRKNDSWITVQPVPDAFIVNVGDQIQVLSNAAYKSVEHRVMVNAAVERLSMAFFYNPKSDVPIGPIRELVTCDRPALYRPMTFDEYRLFIRKKGPRGKSQVDSLVAA
ncbi:jasmonate-induced oxygenase 1-like [Musa acuminata AAA Group]|uniref:jasmonate-induced oxygenase 1-like n=1 Tax=Musa acuminata AAA Group TaxID=214697 RepID=UPI0031E04A29